MVMSLHSYLGLQLPLLHDSSSKFLERSSSKSTSGSSGIEDLIKSMAESNDVAHAWVDCESMATVTQSADNRTLISSLGGVELVMDAMKVHHAAAIVQKHCSRALAQLAMHTEGQTTVFSARGIELLTKATTRGSAQMKILSLGGISHVVSTMQNHTSLPDVQVYGCKVLSSLLPYANPKSGGESLGTIASVLNSTMEQPSIQMACWEALASLVLDNNLYWRIKDVEGISAVRALVLASPQANVTTLIGQPWPDTISQANVSIAESGGVAGHAAYWRTHAWLLSAVLAFVPGVLLTEGWNWQFSQKGHVGPFALASLLFLTVFIFTLLGDQWGFWRWPFAAVSAFCVHTLASSGVFHDENLADLSFTFGFGRRGFVRARFAWANGTLCLLLIRFILWMLL